jgi:L-glyceraldehyde 3-phosphate reductase
VRLPQVTSALVGASRLDQIEHNVRALDHVEFSADELTAIDALTAIWR